MKNLYNTADTILGVSMRKVQERLDALLLVLKTCKGRTCRRPWEALHPDGRVKTLVDALNPKFDNFYKRQHKVKYERCEKGYRPEFEMPIDYLTFGNHSSVKARSAEALANWEMFTD